MSTNIPKNLEATTEILATEEGSLVLRTQISGVTCKPTWRLLHCARVLTQISARNGEKHLQLC